MHVRQKSNSHWLLVIPIALAPYAAGFLVIATRSIGLLSLVGVLVCVGCTACAYFVRRKNKPEEARHRLIIDPFLYAFEFVFTAVLIRYLFLK